MILREQPRENPNDPTSSLPDLSFSHLTVYYQTPQAGEVKLPHKAALLYSPANIQNQPHLT